MVVLGVAPGIKKLAYCVIEGAGDPEHPEWEILDLDKLKGARVAVSALAAYGAGELIKKFRVHDLILSTVWERYTPKVLAVGPAADPNESPRLVGAARSALRTMAISYEMAYIEIESMDHLCERLKAPHVRGLRRAISEHVDFRVQHTRDMCKVVALGAATAATLPSAQSATAPRGAPSIFDYMRG